MSSTLVLTAEKLQTAVRLHCMWGSLEAGVAGLTVSSTRHWVARSASTGQTLSRGVMYALASIEVGMMEE